MSTRMLGKRPPDQTRQHKSLRLSRFLKEVTYPTSSPTPALSYPMDLNDNIGDCVVAGLDHFRQIVTYLLAGTGLNWTEQQIINYYKTQNPGYPAQDDGMVIQEFLDYLIKQGVILAYGSVDSTNWDEVKASTYLGLSVVIGVNLQTAQQKQTDTTKVWDYSPSGDWGGHCVPFSGYTGTPDNMELITWGEKIQATKKFIQKQCDEAWFIITQYHVDHPAFRAGFDLAKFAAAYTEITGKPFPVVIPPAPPSPPVPPTPPVPPSPTPTVMTGFTKPTTITISNGFFGHQQVTIPALSVTVTSGSQLHGALPWGTLISLITQFGFKVLPIVLADISAGKTLQEILQDIFAQLGS